MQGRRRAVACRPSGPGGVARVENHEEAVAEFDAWLRQLMEGTGSDLHVKVGSAPMIRYAAGLRRLDRDAITPMETAAIAETIVPADRKHLFEETGEVDFAYSLKDVGRFRANVFKHSLLDSS